MSVRSAFLIPAIGCALTVLAGPSLVVTPPNGHCRLAWSYDTNELSTNLTFNFYETTNVALPMSQWPMLTNVAGTNLTVDIDIVPGAHFFVMTASNFWGESDVSSPVVLTPTLPHSVNSSLKISKLP